MDEPDEGAIEEPTTSETQAEQESSWFAQEWVSVASVSILLMVVLALALMELSGLIEVFGPLGDISSGVIVLIAGAAVLALIYVWQRVRS